MMMSKNKVVKFPLFWKFAVVSIIVVSFFGSINIYLLWSSVYKSFEKEIDKRCKVLAEIVSEKALSPLVYEDNLEIYNILNEIKRSDPSISYIFILNNTGDLIAQTYDVKIPVDLLTVNTLDNQNYNIKVIKTNHFKYPVIRDIAYPIMKGNLGTVRLGIVEDHIQQEIKDATRNFLIMIIAFLILGLLGALAFSYMITAPIMKLSQRTQVLDLDNIDTEDYIIERRRYFSLFNIRIDDEMDIFVTKFSEMLYRLKTSYKKLKDTQRALGQAEKLASLGTLSAGVAHEINNPISGIKNCVNRIIKDPQNTVQNVKYVVLIDEAMGKIEKVVQHLLNFSRKQDILLKKVNLNLVVEGAIELTKHKLNNNQIRVKTDLYEKYFVNGSANHLEQVFVNLILNSLDAILEKKNKNPKFVGEINLSSIRVGNKVIVRVKDNGAGIPKQIHDKIFDPFFTSKQVGKGTGLGLSVSFNIIEEFGGELSFVSEVGHGAEFTIELPCYFDAVGESRENRK